MLQDWTFLITENSMEIITYIFSIWNVYLFSVLADTTLQVSPHSYTKTDTPSAAALIKLSAAPNEPCAVWANGFNAQMYSQRVRDHIALIWLMACSASGQPDSRVARLKYVHVEQDNWESRCWRLLLLESRCFCVLCLESFVSDLSLTAARSRH